MCHSQVLYITFTAHFNTDNYDLKNFNLRTSVFEGRHTGENIKAEMEKTLKMFNLHQRKVIYVTNNGRNIVKAYDLASG
jgi:hypothetical protein